MSDIDPLAGCGLLCLTGILLYFFYLWIPVAILLAGSVATVILKRPARPYLAILWTTAILSAIVLGMGLIGYLSMD
jgi:hypothetical protein